MGTVVDGFSSTGTASFLYLRIDKPCWNFYTSEFRPRSDEITLSILSRAKACNYTTLVVTVDAMTHGWRPCDLSTSYLPLIHAYGTQIGFSDPVFMQRYGRKPLLGPNTHPKFPYDSSNIDRLVQSDKNVRDTAYLAMEWLQECQGSFRTWEDLKFLRDNWEGPLVLKGIQHVEVNFRFPIK